LGKFEGEIPGETNKNENRANPHKGMTPPSTQNLKTLGFWVFSLLYCSTFSFLLNVGLGYLTPKIVFSILYMP